MKFNVDINKYNVLSKKILHIEEELERTQKEIKNLFPKGYWWSFDIDTNWKRPKKYSIKEIKGGYVVVKEVFKKAPWSGFDGKTTLSFEKLLELNIYQTEEEAKRAIYNRVCPKCGGIMKYSTEEWCSKCMTERKQKMKEFENSHIFYSPEKHKIFRVGYVDELTRKSWKGFDGEHFTLQRMDTNEIIYTDNLWSEGFCNTNKNNLPEIKFLNNKT